MTNKEKALNEFLAVKADIDEMMERLNQQLQAESDNHFGVDPDDVSWAHVGDLQHLRGKMRELTDFVCKTGEYAG